MPVCDASTTFKAVHNIGRPLLMNELEVGWKSFLDYAFLNIGAFTNVSGVTSGEYGGNFNSLNVVYDESFTDGQVWQGVRKDWVYETGISVSNTSPIVQPQIFVNNVLQSANYYIDYPLGRVIFDTPKSISTDNISANYSYRNIQVYRADDTPYQTIIQTNSERVDTTEWTNKNNEGEWSRGGNLRIQLPAIVLEAVPRGRGTPYELGNMSIRAYQDMLFHIIGESRFDRNQLIDILRYQQFLTIWLYNSQLVAAQNAFPLDYEGSLNPVGLLYPDIVSSTGGMRWLRCVVKDTVIAEIDTIATKVLEGVVRMTCEIILGDY